MSIGTPRYGTVDREYGRRLATTQPDQDGPIWMVNLMQYRSVAQYADGRPSTITGQEADDEYSPTESLRAVGASPVFFGTVEEQLLGDAPPWDRVAVVRYATRRSFIEMQSRPEFQAAHTHKDAGMERTIVIGCRPMTQSVGTIAGGLTDPPAVPHPSTEDDGPVMVVHVIRFADAEAGSSTPDEMQAYQTAAAVTASRHGARVAGWFEVEGTIVGDGRAWHQVRFNWFPSKRAFMAVVSDPDRLDAQRLHRELAIADTYTLVVRPTIDRLQQSLQR
jgi:uncharacterized protein (DUF1330 family)